MNEENIKISSSNENKKSLRKLQEDIKKVKKEARTHVAEQTKKIKQLEDRLKAHNAYKQLVTTVLKTKKDPVKIIEGLKFAVKKIKEKNWSMVDLVGGSSGDLEARGECPKCQINLVGNNPRPREMTFPCGITGCPYEKKVVNLK